MDHSPLVPPLGVLPLPPSGLRAVYARFLLYENLRERLEEKEGRRIECLPEKQLFEPYESRQALQGNDSRICIIGAGISGLYLAMMLKFLKFTNVEIVEASDRVGGRCYTHSFNNDDQCPHNYYDIGAMRIPNIDAMQSALNLIHKLGLDEKKRPFTYSLDKEQYAASYQPPSMYWYSNDKTPNSDDYNQAVKDIVADLSRDFDQNFKTLLEGDDDNYSTRSWLMMKKNLKYLDTLAAESGATSTGIFDQAFTESLCDYSDFQAAERSQWFRLEGGMTVVTDTMRNRLEDPDWPDSGYSQIFVKLNRPVVTMTDHSGKIEITTTDSYGKAPVTEKYDMVFNTTAMAPLQRMDLEGLNLPDEVLTGIRTLGYDHATKVAIKFKTPWWNSFYKGPEEFGGMSSSDLPIRNVVYPSWRDGDDVPAVLIVSYSWAQDATRMGALVPDYTRVKPSRDEPLVTLCLQNLVKLWSGKDKAPTFDFLYEQYVEHHAFAWSHDAYSGGAFALFGPGQFKYVYPAFQDTFCGNKFAMCGEALSAHHAWLSGSVDSAYTALSRWLLNSNLKSELAALKESWFGGGEGKHPAEMDEQLLLHARDLKCCETSTS